MGLVTPFDAAWAIIKAPIDVYANNRGRVRTIEDDEMLFSGGDVRDDPRYFSTDLETALQYALFGSAARYMNPNNGQLMDSRGIEAPPMRRTIPSISVIDPSEYGEDEPGMLREDPFSPGFGVMLEDYDDVGSSRLSHDRVIELLQDFINEGQARTDPEVTSGAAFTPDQREKHAREALQRLVAYRNNESLERFNRNPPRHQASDDVYRTSEYDDFMESFDEDASPIEMHGEWDDLEEWQRQAANDVGITEDDWW